MRHKYKTLSRLSVEGQEITVWKVADIKESKHYAARQIDIKTLAEKYQKALAEYIDMLMTIKHPHILTPVDYFIEESTLTLISYFCYGGSLYNTVQQRKTKYEHFSEHLLLNWLLQLLIAIDFIHNKKVLHRRLSLKSIFLTGNAMIKISNFGLPNISQRKGLSDRMHCISPEICQGKEYSVKTYIWSLGCIVSTCANLQYPFEGRTMGYLIRKITTVKHHPIITLYGKHMRQLIDKTLQKDQKKRPTTSYLLFDDLMIKVMKSSVNSSHNLKKELAITLKQTAKLDTKSIGSAMKKIQYFYKQTSYALAKLKDEGIKGKEVDKYVAEFEGLLGKLKKVVSDGPAKETLNSYNLSLSLSKVNLSAARYRDIAVGLEKTIESIGFYYSFKSLTISSKVKRKPEEELGISLKESQRVDNPLAVRTSYSVYESLQRSVEKEVERSLISSAKVLQELEKYAYAHPEIILDEDSLDYTLSNAGSMIAMMIGGSRDSMRSFRISTNSLNPQEGSCYNRDLNITMSKYIEQELRKLVEEQEYEQIFEEYSNPPCLTMQEPGQHSGSEPLYQSEMGEAEKKDLKHLLVLSEIKEVSNYESSVYGGTTSNLNFANSDQNFKK